MQHLRQRRTANKGLLVALMSLPISLAAHSVMSRRHREKPAAAQAIAADVAVSVDAGVTHQTMEGFGATTLALVYGGFDAAGYDDQDNLPALRPQAIRAVYGQVKLNMGNLNLPLLEQEHNDDDNPFNLNWPGFETRESRFVKQKIVDLAKPLGFDDFSLANSIDLRRILWLKELRKTDYNRYLDECAEHVLAGALLWRNTYGITPRTMLLFNEPLSGNNELRGGNTQEVVDIVKRAGARLRQARIPTSFVVPNEETESKSLETATAILSDPQARQYVAAIGYHPYPYGSTYSSIPALLKLSDKGQTDASRIKVRAQLRDLGRRYNIPLWMTEVSHGQVPLESMDALRGRAIHIHDELEYADAAAYFGMNAMWDSKTHQEHNRQNGRLLNSETDTIALIDNEANRVTITGMGYAIGHYARWINRGAQRIEARSSDPLVLISAFVDKARRGVVLVAINNATSPRRIGVQVNNVAGKLKTAIVEQSAGALRWQKVAPPVITANALTFVLPPQSVSTLAADYETAPVATKTVSPVDVKK